MNNIPSEFIIDSIDSYIAKYSTASKKIYWVALTAVVATLIALPFIYVSVSVQEAGVIRPIAEKTEIRANISESVDSVFVKEGQTVNKGDTILTLQRSNPDFQIGYQQKRLSDMQEHLKESLQQNRYNYDKEQNASASLKNSRVTQWQNDLNSTLYAEISVSPRKSLRKRHSISNNTIKLNT